LLEAALARPIHAELAESLGVHESTSFAFKFDAAVGSWTLLPAGSIASEWTRLRDLYAELGTVDARAIGPVSPVFWKGAWIPFASNGAGDLLCIDLGPEPGGTVGQIVRYLRDPSPRECVAHSLADLLQDFASALAADKYIFDSFLGVVPRKAEDLG
jgi:cell wall assembly regulator SMI1